MPYCNVYLPRALEALLEREAAARGNTPGKLLVRTLVSSLTGSTDPTMEASPTLRVVKALATGAKPLAEVARAAGVSETVARETLADLADLRVNGTAESLVALEDRDGTAIWSLAA
jgi:hypothetical protein